MRRLAFLGLIASAWAWAAGEPPAEVPEPQTWLMIGAGLVSIGLIARRRR
jgi:hypothetical protein